MEEFIMARLVECIPNFSCSKEKDEATYNALVETAKSVPGCTLFDAQTDGNHNRCVFTPVSYTHLNALRRADDQVLSRDRADLTGELAAADGLDLVGVDLGRCV